MTISDDKIIFMLSRLDGIGRESEVYRDICDGFIHPVHLLPEFGGTLEMAIELEHRGLAEILPFTSSGAMVRITYTGRDYLTAALEAMKQKKGKKK